MLRRTREETQDVNRFGCSIVARTIEASESRSGQGRNLQRHPGDGAPGADQGRGHAKRQAQPGVEAGGGAAGGSGPMEERSRSEMSGADSSVRKDPLAKAQQSDYYIREKAGKK